MNEMEVPKGWKLMTIPEIIGVDGLFADGDWVESKDQDPSGNIRLIQLADIGVNVFKNKSKRFMNYEKAKKLNCTFLQKNDLLVARMPEPLGRACLFPNDEKKCVTVVDVAVIRMKESEVNSKWLMYMINSPKIQNQILNLQSGTTRKRISRKNLSTIQIPTPPLNIQKKIVVKLDHILSQLEEKKKEILLRIENFDANKINKNYKNHLLKLAFEGTLTEEWRKSNSDEFIEGDLKQIFSENSQLILKNSKRLMNKNYPVPKPWLWIHLSDVFDIQMGQSPPGSSYNSEEKGIPLLNGPTEFKEIFPVPQKYTTQPTKICEKGDLLICVRGNTTGKINFADQKYCIGRGLAFLRPKHDSFDLDLLSYFLMKITHEILEQTSGSTFPNLSQNKLKAIAYPLASKKEQLELVKILDQKFTDWENHKQQLKTIQNQHDLIKKHLNSLSSSILNDAFSGKLVN